MSKLAAAENEQLAILAKLEGAEVLKEHKKDIIAAAQEIRNQISTVVNDFGKKVADSIVHWKSLGSAVKDFFTNLAESTLRIVMERLFKPLQASIEKVIDSLFETCSTRRAKKHPGRIRSPKPVPGGTSSERPGADCRTGSRLLRPPVKQGRASRESSRREIRSFRPIRLLEYPGAAGFARFCRSLHSTW